MQSTTMKDTSSGDNLRSCGEAECPVPQALHGVFGLVGRGWRPRSNPVGGTILRAAVAHGRTTAAACPGAAGRLRTEPPRGQDRPLRQVRPRPVSACLAVGYDPHAKSQAGRSRMTGIPSDGIARRSRRHPAVGIGRIPVGTQNRAASGTRIEPNIRWLPVECPSLRRAKSGLSLPRSRMQLGRPRGAKMLNMG